MPSYVDPPQPPIAIVGIGLRMPGIDGDLTDLDGLAAMSAAGHVAIREIPPERFDIAAWYDPDRNAEGKTYARHAALLSDIAGFDHELFRISPKEARNLDPQQRLLLETTWEGLERAGVPPTSLLGSRTGVYVGAAPGQYRCGDDMYAITGQDTAFTAGRIAYVLGLHGPAITVNTTCSSSLTALHLAVQSLRLGECELALAASAHAIIRPQGFVDLARTQALAPDGWSKTFSAEADGFGRGEGVVALVLAPVERAQAQELPILGLVRGSSLLHDGASRGITAPNSRAQVDMLRTALADAGLKGADIGAVECHGTGTVIGDPIEIKALAEVYGEDRADAPPLILTGLKANVGHLEPAAGLAGLAALLAALKHERLAANPCAEVPNPKIDWANLPVSLSRAPTPWPRGQRVRRAGVSSFGMSGTNAHVIVEEAPVWPAAESKPDRTSPATLPLLLSARSDAALRAQAGRWADWLDARSSTYADPQSSAPSSPFESDPSAIKRSAALHRAHLDMRAAVFAETLPELASKLRTLSEGGADDAIRTASARGSGQTKTGVVFVFPGHGSQWRGMGAALIDASPAFSDCLDRCDAALLPYTGWSVKAVLAAREADAEPDSDRIDVLQPCLFAMGVALASVWRDELGISPDAVLGHSVGEIAAAVVAGALSLDDGARLVALRGRLIAAVGEERDPGAMLAVAAPSEEVRERLAPWRDVLCIAVVNAPEACVVAGERDALGQLQDALEGERTACRRVAIGFGAHSPLMDPILEPFVDGLQDLAPRSAELSFFSPIDGGARDGATLDAAYWRENVRATVRFDRAIAAANAEGHRVFIELGGHPVLGRPMAGAVADGVVVGSLRRGEGDIGILHRALGELHCAGVGIDWRRVLGSGPVVALPTYAFQRRRHWVEQPVRPPVKARHSAPATSPSSHPMTGAVVPRDVPPAPVAAHTPMPVEHAAAAPFAPTTQEPGGAGFMVEQLRVFTELTRRQIDVAAAYAQPASPVAASASPTPLDDLSIRMTGALQPALVGIEDDGAAA
jgi:acyl transferase domain-containing protein